MAIIRIGRKFAAIGGLIVIIKSLAVCILLAAFITDPEFREKVINIWYGRSYLGAEGVILQDKPQNCGPAALQMILEYFGIEVLLKEVEEYSGMTEFGTTMLGLKEAAERKGLHVEGWRYTMTDLIKAPKPALLFVNDNHYIVIDSISSNRLAYGRDPAYGRYSISLRGLKKSWNGETLVFRN